MTSRERILAAVARKPVDYVPCCAAFNPLAPETRRGYKWQFPWAPEAPLEEQLAYQVEELGLDQVVSLSVDPCRPASEVPSRIWLEGEVLHKAYDTDAGELHASVRYNDMWPHGQDLPLYSDFNIGHFVEPWIQDEADLAALQEVRRPLAQEAISRRLQPAARSARALADRYRLATVAHVGTGLTGALQLFGAHELCTMTVERPELVDAYLAFEHGLNIRSLRALAGQGIDLVRRNGFYETADFYGPAMLERFLGDRLRAERDAAHAAGMPLSYTVHTGIMPILDYLAGLELDSLFGIDLAFEGVDPVAVRDKLGDAGLWTGVSSTYHLWRGPEVTREAVRSTFEVFGKTGLILSPCVSVHSTMPWESALAMFDEWKRVR